LDELDLLLNFIDFVLGSWGGRTIDMLAVLITAGRLATPAVAFLRLGRSDTRASRSTAGICRRRSGVARGAPGTAVALHE
jgi:hypothetical protein